MFMRRVQFAGDYVRVGTHVFHKAKILSVTRGFTPITKKPEIVIEVSHITPDIVLSVPFFGLIINQDREVYRITCDSVADRDAYYTQIPNIWANAEDKN